MTSFREIGILNDLWVIENVEDLKSLPENYTVLGAGSNSLIDPNITKTIVKVSSNFCDFELDQDGLICSAGATITSILKWMSKNNKSGLEFAAGVPATIGGMVFMNFECWGYEVSKMIHSVKIFSKNDGIRWILRNEYDVDYRWSSFHEMDCIILAVKLIVTDASSDEIKKELKYNIDYRKEKQPLYKYTFGSVFKNPLPEKAGKLIDVAGLKGLTIGGAQVSEHHANFIENVDSATFDDTITLIEKIQQEIFKRNKINLECEVQIIK